MAAAVVDVCIGELAKLKEKVRPRKLFLFPPQKTDVADEQEVEPNSLTRKQQSSSSSSSLKLRTKAKKDHESTISEATVSLLMDRFAPC